MATFRQIDESLRTESLRPIAVLGLEPEELAQRCGLTFYDDPAATSSAALLMTEAGRQFMLLRHVDDPGRGTEVLASEHSDDPDRDLRELLAALKVSATAIIWKLDRGDALRAEPDLN